MQQCHQILRDLCNGFCVFYNPREIANSEDCCVVSFEPLVENIFVVLCGSQFGMGSRPLREAVSVVAISRGVLGQILLVFRVGLVKGGVIHNRRLDLFVLVRFDFLAVNVPLQLFLDGFGNDLLLFARAKDNAPVLGSAVVSLTVQGGRIVKAVEKAHHFLENFWIR